MRKMKLRRQGLAGGLLIGLAVANWGQESGGERMAIGLTDPERPGLVRVNVVNGSIRVQGCEGKEVVVETNQRGLRVEQSGNEVTIVPQAAGPAELRLTVPARSSLQLRCTNGGNIQVENVEGEIEANGVNASVILRKVAGVVVAHSLQGRVLVQLDKVTPGKAMSFSALNGDVDVTLPPDTKADVKLQTANGSVRSEFPVTSREESWPSSGKRLAGAINGGGPVIQLKTVNGSVFLRKAEPRPAEK